MRDRKLKFSMGLFFALVLTLTALASAFAAIPSIPYGQYNITDAGVALGKFVYPDALKKYFDDKVLDVILSTPTLDRMKQYPDSTAQQTSDIQGEIGRGTTHDEMKAFIAGLPTTYMRTASLGAFPSYAPDGATVEATFDLPILVFSKPAVFDADELRGLGKPVVYFQGQIHGNEMSGGEAMLAIASDLSTNKNGLLDSVSVIIVPRFNVDGTWRNQRGTDSTYPDFGNVDQNRDAVSTISPITRAIRNMLMTYRPDVGIDFHEMGYTTSGSAEFTSGGTRTGGYRFYHDYDLATLVAHPYNVPSGVTRLAYELESGVAEAAAKAGLKSTFYYYGGDMVPGYTLYSQNYDVMQSDGTIVPGYVAYPSQLMEGPPDECISDSAASLAPSVTLLFETRSPKILTNFKTRVYTHYVCGISILNQVAARPNEFIQTVANGGAEIARMGTEPANSENIVLWVKQYEERNPELPVLELNTSKDVISTKVLNMDKFHRNYTLSPVMSVTRPYAYFIVADDAYAVAQKLALMGVTISQLTEAATIEVEAYTVDSIVEGDHLDLSYAVRSGDYFPMNQTVTYGINSVTKATRTMTFPAGAYFFYMSQPGANLAALACEPMANRNLGNYWYTMSETGRSTKGFLPIAVGTEFPAYRYMTPTPLPSAELVAEVPMVSGAYITEVYPLDIGNRVEGYTFGYNFAVANPLTGAAPNSFGLTLPTSRRGANLDVWRLYNWDRSEFETASVGSINGVLSTAVTSEYISPAGEVLAVATQASYDDGSSGCNMGGGMLLIGLCALVPVTFKNRR